MHEGERPTVKGAQTCVPHECECVCCDHPTDIVQSSTPFVNHKLDVHSRARVRVAVGDDVAFQYTFKHEEHQRASHA